MRGAAQLALVALLAAVPSHGAPTSTLRVERQSYADGALAEERGFIGEREEGVHRGWWPSGR